MINQLGGYISGVTYLSCMIQQLGRYNYIHQGPAVRTIQKASTIKRLGCLQHKYNTNAFLFADALHLVMLSHFRSNTFEVQGPSVGSVQSIDVILSGNDGIDLLKVNYIKVFEWCPITGSILQTLKTGIA